MERHDFDDRVVRAMGGVNLVMEAHPSEPNRYLGSVETMEGKRHPMTLNASLTVMSNLCMDASGQVFGTLIEGARWMVSHAVELVAALPAEVAEAQAP